MRDSDLQHPEIGWIERTGLPSWCQEVLGEFEEAEEEEELSPMTLKVLEQIPFGKKHAITRMGLRFRTGLSDRQVRNIIEELRRTYVIINDSDGNGYYRSYDLDDIERNYRQERARALSILRRLRVMRTLLKGGGRL